MKRPNLIPKAAMERILYEAGAKRVSNEAARVFAEIIEEIALDISESSVRIAKHSKRKTVNAGDVKLASK